MQAEKSSDYELGGRDGNEEGLHAEKEFRLWIRRKRRQWGGGCKQKRVQIMDKAEKKE